tara:strand:- start:472 stop:924 length:453 start_codon:yes stop_codon:yes gene_type:complete
MTDIVDKTTRSKMMSSIRDKDTKPELFIRSGLHAIGYRYKLHDKNLPGKPDLVLPKYNAIILVNGCFWHGHDCHLFRLPKTRSDFWAAKIRANIERDRKNLAAYCKLGWRVLTIWECAIRGVPQEELDELIKRTSIWIKGKSNIGNFRKK